MSEQYDKSESGVLFKNDKKTTENHPDYRGDGQVTCEKCGHINERWFSSWINTAKSGVKYMSLKFSKKEQQAQAPQPAAADGGFVDDDVPFAQAERGLII